MKLKTDPIIAVDDVNQSAEWYTRLLGCKRAHGGDHFAVLQDAEGVTLLCLHRWGEHNHPTMLQSAENNGNGLILYFKTDKLPEVYRNALAMQVELVEDLHVNTNSNQREFALRDPDGYYLIITAYHNYQG